MLQNNVLTGLLFFVGIFYNSFVMGVGALIGVLVSSAVAFVLTRKREDIYNGLYGFNGALVGIAATFFFEFTGLLVFFIVFGSVLSSVFMHFMHSKRLSPYTFPFVLSTWLVLGTISVLSLVPKRAQEVFTSSQVDLVSSVSMGFGQVMFQANIVTGILFFLAIVVSSRISAIYGLIGSLIGIATALIFSFPLSAINVGLFGFNAVLCGVAFADEKTFQVHYAILAAGISVFIMQFMAISNLVALTAPFVFSTWMVNWIKKIVNY